MSKSHSTDHVGRRHAIVACLAFIAARRQGAAAAEAGRVVTLRLKQRAATEYGYIIQAGGMRRRSRPCKVRREARLSKGCGIHQNRLSL